MQTICKNNFSALSININKSPSFVDSHMQKLRKAMESRQGEINHSLLYGAGVTCR